MSRTEEEKIDPCASCGEPGVHRFVNEVVDAALCSDCTARLRSGDAVAQLLQGAHPRLVQELFGHSSISITMDTHSHVLPGMDDGLADLMEAALGQPSTRVAVRLQ